jgi:hypothetical protein
MKIRFLIMIFHYIIRELNVLNGLKKIIAVIFIYLVLIGIKDSFQANIKFLEYLTE